MINAVSAGVPGAILKILFYGSTNTGFFTFQEDFIEEE
jgi:hypothetical protein